MDINNNQAFFLDSITEYWTSKDWVLNLIPLGGVASVAYEIGSACLASRDHTTKTARDFFKSPIQTTVKKLAQCLWVPIVICGALQLVTLIVTACWDRCFPHANNQLRKKSFSSADPCEINPIEVPSEILSYLNLHELIESNKVRKNWNRILASMPTLWKAAIYRDIAFSSKDWAQWDKDIVEGVDLNDEYLSLPDNIVELLRRSYKAFPRSIKETHVLVRMPKGLSMNKVEEFARKYFPANNYNNRFIRIDVSQQLRKVTVEKPVWLLMATININKKDIEKYEQQQIVSDRAVETNVSWRIPKVIEAGTCIIAAFLRSHTSDLMIATRCQENEMYIYSFDGCYSCYERTGYLSSDKVAPLLEF